MNVIVNGQPMHVDKPCTVAELLERCGKPKGPCAVEVNRSIVPRKSHADRVIADGDEIEIVTLVGGG